MTIFFVNIEGFLASEIDPGNYNYILSQPDRIALFHFYDVYGIFEDSWSPLDLFSDGSVWDSIWTRKSLRDGRWIFAVYAFCRSKAFLQ